MSGPQIPALKESSLLGSLGAIREDRLAFLLSVARQTGDIGAFRVGPVPMLLLNSSELVHAALVEHANDFDKGFIMHRAFRPVLGEGLFSSEGELHRRQRKTMAPAFQPRHIVNYAQTMVEYTERAQQGWRDGATLDVSREMMAVTMSIVGNVLFQTDVLAETDELGAALSISLAYINYILSSFFPLPLNWPTERNKKTRHALDLLNQRMQKMIDERKASGENGDDFLSILLRARDEDGARMSDQQIKDEALTLFVAGHETTAATLTWTWFLLAQHPDIYQRLQHEVDTVLQGRSPTYADLPRLPYTLQVLKESMRLYPPSIALIRVALRPVELGPYQLRKGQTIMIVPYTIQRRPDYFPNPEQFNPDHFQAENEARLPRFAYIPFGAGPRICIGNHFALMEGHLLLATLAQRVSFTLLPGQQIIPDTDKTITIRPKYGLNMLVKHRG